MARSTTVQAHTIASRIYLIRGQRVMLDQDLAELYRIETRILNLQVKRNLARFPKDFMFRLTDEEWENLRSQIAISSSWGGRRHPPLAFTEHGVLMLSSVLHSSRSVAVNINIMRVFVKMNRLLMTDRDVRLKMESMDARLNDHGLMIEELFEVVKDILSTKDEPRKRLGYKPGDDV